MIDLTDFNTILGIGASIVIIGGAMYGIYRWRWSERSIVCDSCQVLFKPKYFKGKKVRKGVHLEYANCPECGERNEFEVDDV